MAGDGRPGWLDALRPPGTAAFLGLPGAEALAGARAAVVGLPAEAGARRQGARFAPAAVRRASVLLDPYNPILGLDPVERLGCVDLGDVRALAGGPGAWLGVAATTVAAVARHGAVPLVLGGDASVALAAARGLAAAHGPMGLAVLDARPGLAGGTGGVPTRAGAVAQAVADGAVDPARTLVAGVRGGLAAAPAPTPGAAAPRLDSLTSEELVAGGPGAFSQRARERVAAGPCLLAVDVSVLDPAFAPGAADPVPGGPSSSETLTLVRSLVGLDVRGLVCSGLVPEHDPTGAGALVTAAVALELLAVTAFAAPAAPPPGGAATGA